MENNFQLVPLQPSDLTGLVAIEQLSNPDPWSAGRLQTNIDSPQICMDGYKDPQTGSLLGYVCSWLVAAELEILNIAVHPQARGRGIGGRMLACLFARGLTQGMESAWLEVRVGNSHAIALYRRHGFHPSGVRHAYYHDGEDALLMSRSFAPEC